MATGPTGLNSRRPDAGKPGPKPKRDPMSAKRRKLRAMLLRTDPDMVAVLDPPPGKDAAPPSADAHGARSVKVISAPAQPPPWPPNGYAGGQRVRELETSERAFIRQLAVPVDLEVKLARAADYQPLRLSSREADAVLTNFVATMRADVEDRLAVFVEAEHAFRRDGGDAIKMRLDRLRFESDAYIRRLTTAKTVLVLSAQQRERQDLERAIERSNAMVDPYLARAEARAAYPVDDRRPSSRLRRDDTSQPSILPERK